MGETPPDIDLIEILFAYGDMMVPQVQLQVGSAEIAWRIMPKLIAAKVAAIWIMEEDGLRALKAWEVAALVRSRLKQSGESTPPDDRLMLRGAENLTEAYHRDFGNWYEQDSAGRVDEVQD